MQTLLAKEPLYAGMVELVDTLDLGSSAARHGGSTPSTRTKLKWHRQFVYAIFTSYNKVKQYGR